MGVGQSAEGGVPRRSAMGRFSYFSAASVACRLGSLPLRS